MLDTEVYVKTDAGRDEIRSRKHGLSMANRAILLMVDGQRSVSSMRPLIAGSKAPPDVLDALFAQGLIEPRGAAASATPAVAAPAPVAAPPPALPVARPSPPQMPVTPVPPRVSYDGPIDLVLPTIHGTVSRASLPTIEHVEPDEVDEVGAAAQALPTTAATEAATVVTLDRYEHLYAMMNEIVRDFLMPHRRYFFQLRIERCTTPEELLELLHALQTALAKSRGEAFASEVIARLRSAAA